MDEPPPLRFDTGLTLAGAGPFSEADLREALDLAPGLVAADGGHDRLHALEQVPSAVIGDMDSVRTPIDAGVARHPLAEQDSTDFGKALRLTRSPMTIGVGFLGGRLDHTLAALHTLVHHADRAVILIGAEDIAFALPRLWRMNLPEGTRVSLFPMHAVTVRSSVGLEWPLQELSLEAGRQIGTSNRATGGEVRLHTAGPGCILMLPRHFLAAAVGALGR